MFSCQGKPFKLTLAQGNKLEVKIYLSHFSNEQGLLYKWLILEPLHVASSPEDFISGLLNHLSLSLVYVNQNLEIGYTNKQFERLFTVSQSQALNQKLSEVIGSDHYQQLSLYLQKALTGETLSFKLEVSSEVDSIQTFDHQLIPFTDNALNQQGVILLTHNPSIQTYNIVQHKELSQRMKMAVEVANIGVWVFDLKTNQLDVNDVVYAMFQLDKRTFPQSYTNWLAIIHPEDSKRILKFAQNLILQKNDQDKVEYQYRAFTPKGKLKYFKAVFKLLNDGQNQPIKLLGINLDVTDTVKFEHKIIEREKLYRTLAENFPNGVIFILDKELRYKFAAGSELHNIIDDLHQLENRSLFDISSPEIVNKAQENLLDVFKGYTRNFEIKFKKNLNYFISAIPLYDKDGTISEIMVVSQNITELKKAEERIRKLFIKRYHLTRKLKAREAELKNTLKEVLSLNRALSQSQAYQKAILNNTSQAFYLISEDLQVLTFNRVARERIKFILNKKIQKGKSFLLYLQESEIDHFNHKFNKALKGETIEDVHKITYPNDQIVWISCRHAPAYDHQGNIFAVTYSTLDITQQKETENALTIAKERAEEMIRLKTNFLANMSHEIRTPLNGILGLAQVIAKETDLSQIKEYVALQKESGKRLLNTLTGILSLSKLEAEHKSLIFKPIAINQIVRENIKALDALAVNKKIYLIAHTYYQELYCLGDESLLFRILNNLIDNGIKFTMKGYVLIETGLKPNDSSFIFIRVKDTGIGIQDSFIDKIFDPFIQESSGQNRNFEGSGLGLSITKKYVELLGGSIKVASQKDHGSVFEITLPRYKH